MAQGGNARALVLGGGGPMGIAWHVGLAAGLQAQGVDLREAEWILGTSAGATVGGQLALGIDPPLLAELHMAVTRESAKAPSAEPNSDISRFLSLMAQLPCDVAPSAAQLRELGRVALASATGPEADFLARFAGLFGDNPVWPARFHCTAVNAQTGELKLWSQRDEVEMSRAVAASCSVPTAFPPITLNGSPYIDGGTRSWTNADCAAGHGRVLVVAVIVPGLRDRLTRVVEREIATLRAAGAACEMITPDPGFMGAYERACGGVDGVMPELRDTTVYEVGIEQGRREATRLRAFWR